MSAKGNEQERAEMVARIARYRTLLSHFVDPRTRRAIHESIVELEKRVADIDNSR